MRRNKSAMFPYINGRCHANRLQPDGCAMSPVTTGLVKVTTFFILWMMEAESRLQCFMFQCVYIYCGGDALCELCRISVVVCYLVLYPHTFRDVRFLLNNFGLLEMLSPFAAIISPVLFPLVSRYIMYIHIFVSWPCGSLHRVLDNVVPGCGYFHKNLIRIIIIDRN